MPGGAVALLAVALLLLPVAGWAQQKVLVLSKSWIEIDEPDTSLTSTTDSYMVGLNIKPTEDVTVTVTSNDPTAVKVGKEANEAKEQITLTFTTTEWSDLRTVHVTGQPDDVDNPGGGRFPVIVHTPTAGFKEKRLHVVVKNDNDKSGLIIDNDDVSSTEWSDQTVTVTEKGTDGATKNTDSYYVKLASEPTGTVTVGVSSSNKKAATVGPASLTFTTDKWDVYQEVTVTGVDDKKPVDRTVTITHSSKGGGYDGVTGPVSVTVTNFEPPAVSDTAGLKLIPSQVGPIDEAHGKDTFTVELSSPPTDPVTVDIASNDIRIATVEPKSLEFTSSAWDIARTVTITGQPDNIDNEDDKRSVDIVLTPVSRDDDYSDIGQTTLLVEVTNDDENGVTIGNPPGSVPESGSRIYTVQLSAQPAPVDFGGVTDVIIDVSDSADTDMVEVSPSTLTFTPRNWNQARTVTVSGIPDRIANPGRSAIILHRAASGSRSNYTFSDASMTVSINDDDPAVMTIRRAERLEVIEDNTVTYDVELTSAPPADSPLTVTAMSSDETVATVSAPLEFTVADWKDGNDWILGPAKKEITITAAGSDKVVKADQNVTITNYISSGGDAGYSAVGSKVVTIKVKDADTPQAIVKPSIITVREGKTTSYSVSLAKPCSASEEVVISVSDNTTEESDAASTTVVKAPTKVKIDGEDYANTHTFNLTCSSSKTVTVKGGHDYAVNAGGVRTVTVTNQSEGVTSNVTVKITDDDGRLALMFVKDQGDTNIGSLDAGTNSGTYRVRLNKNPDGEVTVRLVSDSPSLTVSPNSVTLTPDTTYNTGGDWDEGDKVVVTVEQDDFDRPSGSVDVKITHTPDRGDVPARDLRVMVKKDHTPELMSDLSPREISEGTFSKYSIRLSHAPKVPEVVSVSVSSSNPSVAAVSPTSLTFTLANWNKAQTVTITGVPSSAREDRTATITNRPSGGGYSGAAPKTAKVTVTNSKTQSLLVDPRSVEVAEGAQTTFSVGLNTELTGTETVVVNVRTDTGVATVSPGSLTFKASNWETNQTITVTGVDDNRVNTDGKKEAAINLSASGLSASVQVTVTDNDAELTVSKPTVTVAEASGTDTYTVVLKGQPIGDVTVAVASSDTTVATVQPSTLTFTTANWSTAQTVTVTGVNDNLDNAGGGREATITNDPSGGGYDEAESEPVTVTVTDDEGIKVSKPTVSVSDEAGGSSTYTVSLATQPPGNVTVAVASSDTTVATVQPSMLTFTTANWSTAQTVTVTGVNDNLDNAGNSRSATISHTSSGYITMPVQVTVTDDDDAPSGIALAVEPSTVKENAGATVVTVTATVNGETRYGVSRSVTVAVGASDDSATKGTDYQTVTNFQVTVPAGAASGRTTFTLTPVDDTEFERTETITVAGTLSGVTVTSASITLTDDDTPPTLSIDSPAVQEGAADTTTPLRFTVTLNKATAQVVTVKYAGSAGGTAEAGADYEALTAGTLTFAEGDTKKTITVTVKGDDMDEDDETLKVMLSSPTIATIDVGTGTGTIRDDDEPPELSIKGATVAEGHAGTTTPLVFTVTKDGATSKEVTVDYKVSGGTAKRGEDYTAPATGTLTFTPDQAAKRITITVKGDNVQEDDETIEITLQAPENATLAAGKSKATGTITDDDVLQTVARDWMARFGRTAAAATVDAIAIRMNDAAGGGGEDHSLTLAGRRMAFAGATPLPLQAAARIEPWEEGATSRITLQDLAEDSVFDLGRSLAEGYLSVWGASSYHQFEKTAEYTLDGNLVSAILGADHAGDHHVAGMALAYHGGGGEYGGIGKDDAKGELTADLYSFHPYVRLTIGDYLHIGGSFGAGTGSMNIKPAGGKEVETSMTMTALGALDARLDLNLSPGWLLAVQADVHTVHMVSAEKKPELPELATATNRIRLGLESSYAFLVGEGMSLAPTVEAGVRHDGGDAETGLGLDAGGGLRFTAAAIGLMVDARGHAVLSNFASDAQTGDAAGALREWGLGGMIRWRPDFGGHGPEVTLAPSYGASAGGLNPGAIPSLDAEVGYRLPAFGGVLTPYSSAEFAGSGQRSYRAGAHLEFGHAVEVSAEGTYQQSATGDAEQFLTLRARLRQ